MNESARGTALDLVVAERWHRLISDIGPLSVARQVASYERLKVGPHGPPPQVFIREMFVPAEPALRRTLDLFCVGFIEYDAPDDDRRGGELVLLGPDTIRAQTSSSAAGLTVADLSIGSAGPEVCAVSMMLMRITRTTGAHDIVVSIEDLGRLLDYQNDVVGSMAVAHAIIRRLEVLVPTTGTSVPVVGTIHRLGDMPGADAHQHYLLVNSDSPLSFDDDLRVRDGHLVLVGADGRAATWRGGDFVLVRFGQPPTRGDVRPLAQLRWQHALVEAGLGRGKAPTAESYSSRAARARQSSRAEQIVWQTLAGDTVGAVTTFRAAAAEPGADGPLIESIAGRITSADDYWLMLSMLAEVIDDTGTAAALQAVVRVAQERLDDRLDQLLGLMSDSTSEVFTPFATPLVFEVSDALVPFVDSNQDGGLFLYELIPAMRERILTGLGVSVPGVRARGNPNLSPGEFTIQVDEVLVETGTALLSGSYAMHRLGDEAPADPGVQLTDTHPLTGESGLWQVTAVEDGAVERGTEHLTSAQYLIHQIDMVFRTHLSRVFGLQEVAGLVEQWTPAQPDLVVSVVPDQGAATRLTWILQTLVDERIPVNDWRAILGAIRDAGGITAPFRTLVRAVRTRLRGQLPGPRSGSRVVRVPAPLQEALPRRLGPRRPPPGAVTHEFQQWLGGVAASNGPVLSLVARDEDTREAVALLARSRYQLVTTFTEEEVASG